MKELVAIVTGASSGIGRATAVRLAREFSAVVIAARNGKNLGEVALEIEAAGAAALPVEIDLSLPSAADELVSRALGSYGRIDSVVNIAGAVPGIDLFDLTDEQWDAATALKLHGARRLTLRAWDALKASTGSVVFTSGTAAVTPVAASAAIGTINAAIEALAKAFADRGIRDGVQVNTISPGPVMTGRRQGLIDKVAGAKGITSEQAKSKFLEQTGINRFGEPEELAELVAFAVSPNARWMTGSVLRMDGGETKSV